MLDSDRVRAGIAACFAAAFSFLALCAVELTANASGLEFIGVQACAECHVEETRRWRGSHHDLSMAVANASTVLGDFDGAVLEHFGVESRFFRKGRKFFVRTDGPDGKLADFEIQYTFGVDPLQQYLVAFPDGRYQALGIAWDSRPREEGGQRWFHLYPNEELPAGDELHWTGPQQNWNHMCAECHSTNLRKGYRDDLRRFETRWSEINVSCEACHGPGSRHVARAREKKDLAQETGLTVQFEPLRAARWERAANSVVVRRVPAKTQDVEIESCARCHSRRSPIYEDHQYGRLLLDRHRVALLDEGLYYPDGQILEEVFVYGSFIQSRMYAAGVRCSDCHESHTTKLRAEGNALCARCHDPVHFNTSAHHHHPEGSQGALCVECHMPDRIYMQVDPRHDHSLRIPRPDLSEKMGTPNACTDCHQVATASWAAQKVDEWYGGESRRQRHWGEALHAGRMAGSGAGQQLSSMLADPSIPAIARATALTLLPRYVGPESDPVFESALADGSPLVRSAALRALADEAPEARVGLAVPHLVDPIRSVRFEAARILAAVPPHLLQEPERARLRDVLADYRASQQMDADRADAHMRLGTLDFSQGDLANAQREYERARELDPTFIPAYVNLADLYRVAGKDVEGEELLRGAMAIAPDNADVQHALGLLYVRLNQTDAANAALERAALLRPENSRYSYVWAVALHSSGNTDRARRVLRDASALHPGDRSIAAFLAQLDEPAR